MAVCYIFSAAEGLPKKFKKEKGDIVIAADAGFNHLLNLKINPDIVLGDFDSLGFVPECTEIIKHPVKKDDTDTMLAVKTGLKRGFNRFVLYGCLGKRLDHTLANIQTLNYIASNGGIGFICGDDYTVTSIKNSSISFSAKAAGNISLFSADTKASGVTVKGLLYELENAEITSDFPIGVSNEFVGKKSTVTVKNGTLNIIFSGNTDIVL